MRRILVLVLSLGFFVSFLRAADSAMSGWTIPQIALGGGYECIILVSNKSMDAFDGQLYLRQGNALGWAGAWTVNGQPATGDFVPFNVPIHGTKKLVLQGDSELRAGYANMICGSGAWARVAVTLFYNFYQGGKLADSVGGQVLSTPTEMNMDHDLETGKVVLSVEKSARVNTGIAFTHGKRVAPATAQSVVLCLRDEAGTPIRVKTLGIEGHQALFIDEIWTDLPGEFCGMLQVVPTNKDVAVYVAALRLEYTDVGFQLTSTPPDNRYRLLIMTGGTIWVDEDFW